MPNYELFFAITISCLVTYNIAADASLKKYYICPNNASPEVVIYGENELVCPKKFICNHDYLLSGRETIPRPCLPPATVCNYKCQANLPNVATVNYVDFTCQDGYQCNSEYNSCEICIPKPCDTSQYTCNGETTVVFEDGLELECPQNTVCNKDYVFPCSPCINSTFPGY